ncbi:pyrimidine (deoxy)nucleoside triphosphate diphosphatase [Rahnella sp. SL6]|uniref:pyrimidine (deoxy)nucleoside triphosphate diphosphatase n=1 Tax=Rahnella perminowiae TaxID=2816244 RepID=UPI001C25B89C|nr:pyrimidine (deoxy)nucleoside triphosphate diphosphatase [Rahnella perminowiae]MBU9811991.1 pyrimidine (deoxy)nucleoside triphosphate diphosphatase [Rahnella perminowiae]MBU9828201.1 pyrimidine (deoxy)nucleoside triphosphate diphosphatase [Rahnella perminowiae]UJD89284.1 pyrimidine (deoxy)nucleoside triphosphate diphosphatase [Rahnella aquatilis]
MKTIEVVAALIECEGKLLIARRDASGDQAGLWEFPGGKVEAGESQPAALVRELWEEMRINATVTGFVATSEVQHAARLIRLHGWRVSGFTGTITLQCHSEIRWVTPAEVLSFELAPADVPLIEAYLMKFAT